MRKITGTDKGISEEIGRARHMSPLARMTLCYLPIGAKERFSKSIKIMPSFLLNMLSSTTVVGEIAPGWFSGGW